MFIKNLLLAAVMAMAACPVVCAQSFAPDDLYYDFEVIKRQPPLFCFDYLHVPSGQPGQECHDTRTQRDARVAQLRSMPDITITSLWTGYPSGHPGQRWTSHSIEQTYADAYHQAKQLELTGRWEARIIPFPAPFSFLDSRYSFGIR